MTSQQQKNQNTQDDRYSNLNPKPVNDPLEDPSRTLKEKEPRNAPDQAPQPEVGKKEEPPYGTERV